MCAVVVTHFPPPDFGARLSLVMAQVEGVVVVDNTPTPAARLDLPGKEAGVRLQLIANGENRGIATALNQGLACALEMGYDWVLTLDQDTTCSDDLVSVLMELATACPLRPAVVGSNHERPGGRREGACAFEERHVVITSGSLIDARFCREIGAFRDAFFIDQVDFEYCLRVRSHGRKVVIAWDAVMQHAIGDEHGRHSALREYYIARNAIALVSEYFRREPEWCRRRLADLVGDVWHVIIRDRQRVAKVRAISAGVLDALLKRMGPCRRPWLCGPDSSYPTPSQ